MTAAPLMSYCNSDNRGMMFDNLILKASYGFTPNGSLKLLDEQDLLNFSDLCFGDVNTSSLFYPSDLVSYKPNADLILLANSYSPDQEPCKSWVCSFSLKGGESQLSKTLTVSGPRTWEKQRGKSVKWKLSEPTTIEILSIRYEFSFGGSQRIIKDDAEVDLVQEHNPIGLGWCCLSTEKGSKFPAHQISYKDQDLESPEADVQPAGFGPIPPVWLPRRPLGGTFDDD